MAVFTTRIGGFSQPPFASLNLALHTSDDPRAVIQNRALLAKALMIDPGALTFADQVHGANVSWAGPGRAGAGALAAADAIGATDALVANEPGPFLMILTADCLPIILADPKRRMVAAVHAGWRGTLERVAANAVKAMVEAGADPTAIKAWLGPAICESCYEISPDLYEIFSSAFALPPAAGKPRLDLARINRDILVDAGLRNEQVGAIDLCTSCRPDLFYSWRREGETGRQAALVGLLPIKSPTVRRP